MTQNPMIGIDPEQADVSIKIELTGKGEPGYIPQRGVDYWTEEDKQEIVDDVKQEIGELPGGGTVKSVNGKKPDKNGNVVVDPELPSAWDIPSSDPLDPMPYDKVLGTEFGSDGEPKWVLQSPPSAEAVRYTAQTLNVNQQAQARKNIGAQPAGDYVLKSEIPSVAVRSVNGKTGDVVLTADDVGAAKKEDIDRLSEEIGEKQPKGDYALKSEIPAPYTLPTASAEVKGGVKINPKDFVMDGDVLGVKPEGVYELIETITVEEDGIVSIQRDITTLDAVMVLAEFSKASKTTNVFLFVNFSGEGRVTGGNFMRADGQSSARFCAVKKSGYWDLVSNGYVRGWGSGQYYGQGDAADVLFVSKNPAIIGIKLYAADGAGIIPIGSVISIWGVRANA